MVNRLIGKVEEVDTDTWKIKFSVNKLFKDITDYPEAVPLFGITQEVRKDDPVCVFYNEEFKDAFYYTQITKENFVGLFNQKCEIDLTDGENIVMGSKNEIQLNGSDDWLVMHNKLKSDLNTFVRDVNNALRKYATKMTIAWTALNVTGGKAVIVKPLSPDTSFDSLSIDIEDAKAKSLRTSGDPKPREDK